MKTALAIVAGLVLPGLQVANAAVVTSLSNATAAPIPPAHLSGGYPVSFDSGLVSFSGTSTYGDLFGDTASFCFGSNGCWNTTPFAATQGDGTLAFTFTNPVQGVLALVDVNSYPGQITVAAFDSSNHEIEAFTQTVAVTGNNTGVTLGFLEGSPEIKTFEVEGFYAAATNLEFLQGSAVPEPGSALLLGSALIGLLPRLRRALTHA